MNHFLPAARRAITPAWLLLLLGACHGGPGADATAQGDRLHECLARSQQEMPASSERDRQTHCHDQVGRAAFEVPPTAAPAPVH